MNLYDIVGESLDSQSKLVIFDIDDTLVHTATKVIVVKDGRAVQELNSHQFTHYKLKPGESFDFGQFRNAREFFEKSRPIIPMMNQLKADIATGNRVVMVTARSDFDDRELFLDTFRKYGVDMSKVHVYRAGNITDRIPTEEKKKRIIRDLLNRNHYAKAIMYDDAVPNLDSFVSLKKEYPQTKFYAWHVSLEGEATEYQRTNEQITESETDHDHILAKLCQMILDGQMADPEYHGMVAACVLDPDQKSSASTSVNREGKWAHAERMAIEKYVEQHGDIPEGCIVITTLSPCSKPMNDRYGDSCEELLESLGIKEIYCGYQDPTHNTGYRITEHPRIQKICKKFADTFLPREVHEDSDNKTDLALNQFVNLAKQELGLDTLPDIQIVDSVPGASGTTFGQYKPEENCIYVVMKDRHPKDAFRTLGHELVHYKQDQEGRIKDDSGETGSPEENEANAMAGVIMRNYNKANPESVTEALVPLSKINPPNYEVAFRLIQQFLTVDNFEKELAIKRELQALGYEIRPTARPGVTGIDLAHPESGYRQTVKMFKNVTEDFTGKAKPGSRPGSLSRKAGKKKGEKIHSGDIIALRGKANRMKKSTNKATRDRGIQLQRQLNWYKNFHKKKSEAVGYE